LSERADGKYQGTIAHAYVAEDQFNEGSYVLKLDVNLEGGGAVTCRQSLDNDDKGRRNGVLKELGLSYPFASAELTGLTGREIDINLKTSAKGRQNAYVSTQREERVLTPEEIDRKLSGGSSDIPF